MHKLDIILRAWYAWEETIQFRAVSFPPLFFCTSALIPHFVYNTCGMLCSSICCKSFNFLSLATWEREREEERNGFWRRADIRTGIFIVLRWACKSFLFPYELRRRDSVYIWGVVISKCWESRLKRNIYIQTYHIYFASEKPLELFEEQILPLWSCDFIRLVRSK